jgi:energy-coupling factor transporter ATP-binding protein EcfA2
MDIQGDRWNQALNKILKRLALNEKPGFLILAGPKGSGKTDLLDLVRKITQHQISMEEIKNEENFKLAKAVYGKKYLCIYLSSSDKWASAPAIILNSLIDKVCADGANKGQNILLIWDNIDKAIDSSYEEMNKRFLGEIYQPFPMYNNLTFICAVTSVGGKTFEPFNKNAIAPHLMHLSIS